MHAIIWSKNHKHENTTTVFFKKRKPKIQATTRLIRDKKYENKILKIKNQIFKPRFRYKHKQIPKFTKEYLNFDYIFSSLYKIKKLRISKFFQRTKKKRIKRDPYLNYNYKYLFNYNIDLDLNDYEFNSIFNEFFDEENNIIDIKKDININKDKGLKKISMPEYSYIFKKKRKTRKEKVREDYKELDKFDFPWVLAISNKVQEQRYRLKFLEPLKKYKKQKFKSKFKLWYSQNVTTYNFPINRFLTSNFNFIKI